MKNSEYYIVHQSILPEYFEQVISKENGDFIVGTIGRKAYSYVKNKNYPTINKSAILVRDDVMYVDVVPLVNQFVQAYEKGSIDKLVIIYNHFVNSLNIEIKEEVLLPIDKIKGNAIEREYLFEGGIEDITCKLLPMYIQTVIYGIILDAKTAEHSSRMNSMKNATDNAEEGINSLGLLYNRARQAAITLELTDIVGGASVINEN